MPCAYGETNITTKKGRLSNKCHFIVIKRTRHLCVIIAGLLAVGSTDGLVKVFCLQVFPSINGIAQYVLWGDKDDMQVQWINWLYSPQVCLTHVLLLTPLLYALSKREEKLLCY